MSFLKRNTSLLIAFRYFSVRRKKNKSDSLVGSYLVGQNFIKTLTNISMVGVGVGSASLVIILSVFNGLEELTMGLYATYNPEIRIAPVQGKSFMASESVLNVIKETEGVAVVTEVIEDDAYLEYGAANMMVTMKGVSDNFMLQYNLGGMLVQGRGELYRDSVARALLGVGVYHQLGVQINDMRKALLFYYPRRDGPVSVNPDRALVRRSVLPGGVLAIEQKFDSKYVLVPLDFARQLTRYEDNRLTSIEVKTITDARPVEVQQRLRNSLPSDFQVLTAEEQQASVLRAVYIERLFVFITFVFILAIASLNVFFSLAMLAIEKKKDISVLVSLGANMRFVKRIFLAEGVIVAFTGAFLGLLFGFLIVYLQEQFGFVPLGVPSSIVEAYPVKLKATDFLYTGAVVVAITLVASYIPARNAARIRISEHLQ